ncbi:MAG: acyl-CoA/acyl-ACP dehydrogenase [Archangiaceae bacterium]|nr:acyl-CoA/acyl-ACP dehydrogenase [Archangiaceae bacterium]
MAELAELLRAIDALGPRFAERAAEADRSGAFATANCAELKARRIYSAGVPVELGGAGLPPAELGELTRTLAHHCPATALALAMHQHLVATAAWRHRLGQPTAPLLGQVAQGQRVLVTTGAGDWVQSSGSMRRVEGGYRVTAKKRFASGLPAADLLLSSAVLDEPAGAPTVVHFAIPADTPGVSSAADWDGLGMRASGSDGVQLDEVMVADTQVTLQRPRDAWHPSLNLMVTVAVPIISSVYVGVAERASELTRLACAASTDPLVHARLGELLTTLFTAQALLKQMFAATAPGGPAPDLATADATLKAKSALSRAVRTCLDQAVALTGGAAVLKTHLLERLWRDAQSVQFHPLAEAQQQLFSGRVALGLPPMRPPGQGSR